MYTHLMVAPIVEKKFVFCPAYIDFPTKCWQSRHMSLLPIYMSRKNISITLASTVDGSIWRKVIPGQMEHDARISPPLLGSHLYSA
jgi:hypothetical protein